jgi:hypothetical protein
MGWVVKSWRVDAQQIAQEAALREVADACAYLDVLEQMGVDTRHQVQQQRLALRAPAPAAPAPASRRPGRAVLRESPLTELFRATAQG